MIEEIILQYLAVTVDVEAFGEMPPSPPEEYIVICKAGAEREDHIDTAIIRFDCYAGSKYRAAELSSELQNAIDSMIQLDNISYCEFGGDYDNTDRENKKYCYRVMYSITYF